MKILNAEEIIRKMSFDKEQTISVATPDMKIRSVEKHSFDMNGDVCFTLDDGKTYCYKDLIYYNPANDGSVVAICIFNREGDTHQPTATLAFAFGGSFTFEWDRTNIRKIFEPGINAYTLFYDTRCCNPFNTHVKDESPDLRSWPIMNTSELLSSRNLRSSGGAETW